MLKRLLQTVLILGLAASVHAEEAIKTVYHLNESGYAQARRALNFINNHLGGDPGAKIVVLAQGDGIMFLTKDARNDNGAGFGEAVATLQAKGVEFEVCSVSLLTRQIDPSQLLLNVKQVRSGVVELARLQAVEKYAYIRP